MLSRFDTIPERDRQTDGRTELLYQYRTSAQQRTSALLCWRAIRSWQCSHPGAHLHRGTYHKETVWLGGRRLVERSSVHSPGSREPSALQAPRSGQVPGHVLVHDLPRSSDRFRPSDRYLPYLRQPIVLPRRSVFRRTVDRTREPARRLHTNSTCTNWSY